ncbi:MAG TPA: PepSY-associated TM helix domain-containing protein [Polyangiaceae bacterium]|jgi:hypothetical protein|nr:PepSY-associated TM helix domain-containing protein [Polyangiaceae bacterium]
MKSFRLRPWLRALHRDIGYASVGLTIVYALSGLAVNHIADWDPNFTQIHTEQHVQVPIALPTEALDDDARARLLATRVLEELKRPNDVTDAYLSDATHLELTLGKSTLHVDLTSGAVVEDGQKERFFLRAANWLHLNRGKKAWKYVADGYAVFLLFLAASGLFMIPGRKGIMGRGAILALLGALVPVLYVVLSGGPSAH